MKTSLKTFVAGLLVLGAAIALIGAACGGGGGEMTAEEYFKEIERLFQETDARVDEIDAEFEEAVREAETEKEAADILVDFLGDVRSVTRDALSKFNDIKPPSGVKDLHDGFASSIDAMLVLTGELASRLKNADTAAQIEAAYAEFDEAGTAASERSEQACFDLQDAADDAGISVDLRCGE